MKLCVKIALHFLHINIRVNMHVYLLEFYGVRSEH